MYLYVMRSKVRDGPEFLKDDVLSHISCRRNFFIFASFEKKTVGPKQFTRLFFRLALILSFQMEEKN